MRGKNAHIATKYESSCHVPLGTKDAEDGAQPFISGYLGVLLMHQPNTDQGRRSCPRQAAKSAWKAHSAFLRGLHRLPGA